MQRLTLAPNNLPRTEAQGRGRRGGGADLFGPHMLKEGQALRLEDGHSGELQATGDERLTCHPDSCKASGVMGW